MRSLIRFVPDGFRTWKVTRNAQPIAVITTTARGLIVTVEGAGLNVTEMEAVTLFIQNHGAEDEMERARR